MRYLQTLLALAIVGASIWAPAQAQILTLTDSVQFQYNTGTGNGSSDCWGWTDANGVDYAIIGNQFSLAFVRASDGMVLDTVPAPSGGDFYYHRDMVTYRNYAYCVAEMGGVNEGLMIIDLSPLPDSVRYIGSWTDNNFRLSHNMDVDTAMGFIYMQSGTPSGIRILDIANPESPVEVGLIPAGYAHDMHARNDTVWYAEPFNPKGFAVYDLTDKGNPVLIGEVRGSQFGTCHNIWPSDDGRFFATTEESTNRTVKVWELDSNGGITQRGAFLAPNGIAHNVHVLGKYLFISHYSSGLVIVDWSDPDNLVQAAAYDTYPADDLSGFHGSWGCFPYTANGYVYNSSFDGLLHIFQFDSLTVGLPERPETPGMAWPNPFDRFTNVGFQLEHPSEVRIRVLDQRGRVVDTLLESTLNAGNYTQAWNPRPGIAAGTYFIAIEADGASKVHKIIYRD